MKGSMLPAMVGGMYNVDPRLGASRFQRPNNSFLGARRAHRNRRKAARG